MSVCVLDRNNKSERTMERERKVKSFSGIAHLLPVSFRKHSSQFSHLRLVI